MATKKRVSFDEHHGLYHRTIGLDRNGRKPKFWLGDDERQAEQRNEQLEKLWSQVEADWPQLLNHYTNWHETEVIEKPDKPLWDDITLGAAKALAKGETSFPLPRNPAWSPVQVHTADHRLATAVQCCAIRPGGRGAAVSRNRCRFT